VHTDDSIPTAIFASGSGTNLQAVIDAAGAGELPLDVRVVVTDREDAGAIVRARRAGIEVAIAPWRKDEESRAHYAHRLAGIVRAGGARLVLLLGWMHVLAREFLDAGFEGVLNLHPAYLPDDPAADVVVLPDGTQSPVFRGAHALRDAIEAGVKMTGASLIEITPLVDRGPLLARHALSLRAGEPEREALERLHEVERAVVKAGVLRWIARARERKADAARRTVPQD